MQQSSSLPTQGGQQRGPPIVYCRTCKGRPMAIKSLRTSIFKQASRAVYVCADCGLEAAEPFRRRA
jgi:hypothetical protein